MIFYRIGEEGTPDFCHLNGFRVHMPEWISRVFEYWPKLNME